MEDNCSHSKHCNFEDVHPGVSIGEFLFQRLKEHAKSSSIPAQIECETGVSMSFPELLQASVQAALALRKRGLKRGDTIAFFSRNKSDLFPVLVGAVMEGITATFLIPSSTEAEVRHFLSLTRPAAVVSEPEYNSPVALRVAAPGTLHLCAGPRAIGPDAVTVRELLESASEASTDSYRPVLIEDIREHVAFIQFSSGTSGLPKAMGLSNYGLLCVCLDPGKIWDVFPGERILISSLLSWVSGVNLSFIGMVKGNTRLVANYTCEQDIANIIEKFQANYWIVAPPRLTVLAEWLRSASPRPDLSSLRALVTGGVTLGADKQRLISHSLGVTVLQAYGSTETSLITVDVAPPRPGSAGRPPSRVNVRVADLSSRKDLTEPGAIGEVRVKSAFNMKGYVNNPEATAAAFDEHGFYCTGDLGYLDQDGYLFIVDRIKELLKYNGRAMAPAELEGVLLSHPDVSEACVVGRPHPRLGDLPTAFVVRRPGSSVSAQQLQDLIAGELSDFKQLRGGVYFEKELKKLSNGKVDRKGFKMRFLGEEEMDNSCKNTGS